MTLGFRHIKSGQRRGKRPISYYPFGNSILSFQSQHQNDALIKMLQFI